MHEPITEEKKKRLFKVGKNYGFQNDEQAKNNIIAQLENQSEKISNAIEKEVHKLAEKIKNSAEELEKSLQAIDSLKEQARVERSKLINERNSYFIGYAHSNTSNESEKFFYNLFFAILILFSGLFSTLLGVYLIYVKFAQYLSTTTVLSVIIASSAYLLVSVFITLNLNVILFKKTDKSLRIVCSSILLLLVGAMIFPIIGFYSLQEIVGQLLLIISCFGIMLTKIGTDAVEANIRSNKHIKRAKRIQKKLLIAQNKLHEYVETLENLSSDTAMTFADYNKAITSIDEGFVQGQSIREFVQTENT